MWNTDLSHVMQPKRNQMDIFLRLSGHVLFVCTSHWGNYIFEVDNLSYLFICKFIICWIVRISAYHVEFNFSEKATKMFYIPFLWLSSWRIYKILHFLKRLLTQFFLQKQTQKGEDNEKQQWYLRKYFNPFWHFCLFCVQHTSRSQ